MEHWMMKAANDPDSPPWWVWLILTVALTALAYIFGR